MKTGRDTVSEAPANGSVPELRNWQANSLRSIMGHSGLVVDETIDLGIHQTDHRFDDRYGSLGERLYTSFAARTKATQDKRLMELSCAANILNGSYALASILSYAPAAYAAYNETHPEYDPSIEALADILKRSTTAPKLFADLSSQANHTFEINFGLQNHAPVYEPVPFVVEPGKDSQLTFNPATRTLQETLLEVARRRLGGDMPMEDEPGKTCPAIGRVMTAMWNAGIDTCVSEQQFFEASVAEALSR